MTLTELRYIVAVADERNFSRAAERSFVSQPSLSASVRKLETREEIVSVVQTGDCFVVVTRRKPGRPAKETRVTAQAETR